MRKPSRSSAEFGATGRRPLGQVAPHDEGELRFGIASDSGRVLINFGKPVHSLGLDASQAEMLAETLVLHARRARRQVEAMEAAVPQG